MCAGARRGAAHRSGRRSALAVLALSFAFAGSAAAQTQSWVPGKGHGSVSVAYQDLFVATHTLSDGTPGFPGTIDSHSVFLGFDYGLTDRLAISVGLPYKSNRFVGPGVHNPATLYDDHGESVIDDGDFHSGWQNWNVALRYLWKDEGLHVVPYVSYGSPSHDYTTFAHAALGTGQQFLEFGVNIGRRFEPPRQNLYFHAGLSYSVMEKVEARRVNHATLNAELGYFFTPRLSASVLATFQRTYNGYDFPEDYPNQRDEHFFHHDQDLRNDFNNYGAALSFQATPRTGLFLTYGHTGWGENTHLIDHSWTLGVSRQF
jgi:hypothetical protein